MRPRESTSAICQETSDQLDIAEISICECISRCQSKKVEHIAATLPNMMMAEDGNCLSADALIILLSSKVAKELASLKRTSA